MIEGASAPKIIAPPAPVGIWLCSITRTIYTRPVSTDGVLGPRD